MTLPNRGRFLSRPEREGETAPAPNGSDLVAVRAYSKWVRKGKPSGTALQDWLEAEAEVREIHVLAERLAEANASLQAALADSLRREQELRQAEARYHGIFDNAVEGIFQITVAGRFLAANPALARMLGFASPEELLAEVGDLGCRLHVCPRRGDEFLRQLRECGRVQGFECQVYRHDGRVIWVSLSARAVRDAAGALRWFEGMVEDVTERKRAEEVLKNSEAFYTSLVGTLPVCMFRKDLHGRFTFVNQGFCDWLKRPLAQVLGKTDLDFYPEELAQKYIGDDRSVLETQEMLEAVEEHQKPGEERIYVQVLKAPLFDAHGQVVGLQGIFWDITARKRAESEMARTAAEFRVARTIQQRLFPSRTPKVAGMDLGAATFGYDLSGATFPAEAIGGDYYDFIPLIDGSLGIAIGDVSGHGVGPALLMAEARALLRAFAQTQADVGAILRLVNRVLIPDTEGDRFITLLLAKLDPRSRSFVYASAGHQPGFLIDGSGRVKRPLPSTSIPLGILADADFPLSDPITLEPGDVILLLTDGVVEARAPDGAAFGQQRPLDLVRVYRRSTARQIVDQLYYAVRAFSLNLPQFDDITMTVLKVNPSP